jgi:hypothetical protein
VPSAFDLLDFVTPLGFALLLPLLLLLYSVPRIDCIGFSWLSC